MSEKQSERVDREPEAGPKPPPASTETLKNSIVPARIPKEIGRYHIKRKIALALPQNLWVE